MHELLLKAGENGMHAEALLHVQPWPEAGTGSQIGQSE